jgi:hypothetical protein
MTIAIVPSSKIGWIVTAVIAAVLIFSAYEWSQEHDARIKAEATVTAAQTQIQADKATVAKAQTDLAARLSTLEAARSQPATPQQIVISAAKLFPNLPQPLQVVTPPPTQQVVNGKPTEVPSAAFVQVPAADLKTLQDYAITCEENNAKLGACTLTQATTVDELKATTTQRDAYKAELKGGTFWQRFRHDAKIIGITAVVAGGTAYALGKK